MGKMLVLVSFLLLLQPFLVSTTQVKVVQDLIDRVLRRANISSSFNPEIIYDENSSETKEYFSVSSRTNKVVLQSNTLVGLTAAFGHYLRYVTESDFMWEDGGGYSFGRLNGVKSFPLPKEEIKIYFYSKLRYYQNTCTASYSFAFKNWNQYEQEIDWMLMSGINMPLAHHGQEYVWRKLYYSYNLTSSDLDEFFSGPAFFAWQRMANIRKFGGPLPATFIDAQYELQKNVLARYKEFDIKPVLPGFNGVVPPKFFDMYPDSVQQMGTWNDFPAEYCCSYIIDASDPLFVEVGAKFIELYNEVYDTLSFTHYYNIDTFNENLPLDNSEAYLYDNSNAVYNSIVKGDPAGVWIMQAWLFVNDADFWQDDQVKYYLSGVPDDRVILLDLTSEYKPVYEKIAANNKSFLWCMLHNYGGARTIYGELSTLYYGLRNATTRYPTLALGIGLTMEAIDQNPVQYEFMQELSFVYDLDSKDIATLTIDDIDNALTWPWIRSYVNRRYTLHDENSRNNVEYAWNLLWKNSYTDPPTCKYPCNHRRGMLPEKPLMTRSRDDQLGATALVEVWEYLLKVEPYNTVQAYKYDVVDVTRQVLSNLFQDVYVLYQAAYNRRDITSLETLGPQLLLILADIDHILGTSSAYLLGKWIESAKSWAVDSDQALLYEYNARNQLTLWGPTGEIDDYASKNWQGLVGDYYYSRWELFITSVLSDVKAGNAFDVDKYSELELELGEKWCSDTTFFTTEEVDEANKISLQLQYRYGNKYKSPHKYEVVSGFDIPAFSIYNGTTWTKNVNQMKYLCDAEPLCKGFTSTGYLKSSSEKADMTPSINTFLYLKQDASAAV